MDSTSYYTSKYSGEEIDEAVRKILDGEMTGDYADRQLSNLDTPQAALANLGAGVRPNLLINPFFQVNQRGQNEYAATGYTVGYTVDAWSQNGAANTVSVLDDGVEIVFLSSGGISTFDNSFEKTRIVQGRKYTVSLLTGDVTGNVYLTESFAVSGEHKDLAIQPNTINSFTFTAGAMTGASFPQVRIWANNSGNKAHVKAVKLEEGSTQTLAYQDEDGAWQLLPQPESDYATQLAKCQRYFRSFNAWTKFEADYINANRVSFSIPGDMRIDPTVTGDWGVYTGFTLQNGFVLEGHRTGSNLVVVASKESHGLTTAWLGVKDNSFGYLNADL